MDTLIATVIAVVSHSLFFFLGMAVANRYNNIAQQDQKDALERQYMRLQARADADDPCKPYKYRLPEGFEQQLRASGQATAMLKKSKTDTQSA